VAGIALSITKSTSFRGGTQEFSNAYFYLGGSGTPSATQADTLIDELAEKERTFHAAAVTFVRGRLWTNTGSPSTSNMISQKNLSGIGARATDAALDKERAFLFRLRAGVDSRGQPVYLRKWFHACGAFFSGQAISDSIKQNTASIPTGDRSTMVAAMAGIGSLTSAVGPWTLAAKSGRQPDAGALWTSHPYLEHRQLGDMWRAQ
jgi:hypothetical protein